MKKIRKVPALGSAKGLERLISSRLNVPKNPTERASPLRIYISSVGFNVCLQFLNHFISFNLIKLTGAKDNLQVRKVELERQRRRCLIGFGFPR